MRERDAVEVIEKEGPGGIWKASIYIDDDPQSPADWDEPCKLITWHRNYRFQEHGPEMGFEHGQDWLDAVADEIKRGDLVYINVGMYDHSGISLYEGSEPHAMDGGGWDSGQVGFMYTTPSIWTPCMGEWPKGRGSRKLARVEEVLRGVLKTWDQFVTGDIYYIEVKGPKGEHDWDDSCGGFYGLDYAKEEAGRMLEGVIEHERKELAKIQRVMAL